MKDIMVSLMCKAIIFIERVNVRLSLVAEAQFANIIY